LLSSQTYRKNSHQNSHLSHPTFGMLMPERSYSATTKGFRFGFNGKESDDEVSGDGNTIAFEARIFDSRLGRWMSMDPLQTKYPSLSPYNFVANNPIYNIDPDGERIAWFASKGVWKYRKSMLSTPTGTFVWKQMKKSKTRISVYMTDKVILKGTRDGDAIAEGNTLSYNIPDKGKNKDGSYHRAKVYVSTGTYRLKTAIENTAGQTIDNMTNLEAYGAIQDEIASGMYEFIILDRSRDFGGGGKPELVDYPIDDMFDYIPITIAPDHGTSDRAERLENETLTENLERVGGHEGVHSYYDGKATKLYERLNEGDRNPTKKSKDDFLESEPNKQEGEIIREQKSRRKRRSRQ
jgi:RHS repeat-associated protein